MAGIKPPGSFIGRNDHELHVLSATLECPCQQRHHERISGSGAAEQGMHPHGQKVHDRGVLEVRRTRNKAARGASLFKDQRDARREPALPVGCCPSQLARVGGSERLRGVAECLEAEGAKHGLIPKDRAAHIHDV